MTTIDFAAKRAEADAIARRRTDAIQQHPATLSKLPPHALVAAVAGTLEQVERQQILGSLLAAIGDDRLDITSDRDLPLIVGTLLITCPQAISHPRLVAKCVQEGAASYAASLPTAIRDADDPRGRDDDADDYAWVVSRLAAGTAHTATYGYLMQDCQALADWLTAAAQR